MSEMLLSRSDVERLYGISKRWLELAALSGDGPPMIRISKRMIRYRKSDIDAFIEGRLVGSTSQ